MTPVNNNSNSNDRNSINNSNNKNNNKIVNQAQATIATSHQEVPQHRQPASEHAMIPTAAQIALAAVVIAISAAMIPSAAMIDIAKAWVHQLPCFAIQCCMLWQLYKIRQHALFIKRNTQESSTRLLHLEERSRIWYISQWMNISLAAAHRVQQTESIVAHCCHQPGSSSGSGAQRAAHWQDSRSTRPSGRSQTP